MFSCVVLKVDISIFFFPGRDATRCYAKSPQPLPFTPLRPRRGDGGEVARANPTPNPSPLAGRGIYKVELEFCAKRSVLPVFCDNSLPASDRFLLLPLQKLLSFVEPTFLSPILVGRSSFDGLDTSLH